MKRIHALLALALLLPVSPPAALKARAGEPPWRPITPEELGQKTPVVEQDADAEVLFWDVRVYDEAVGDSPRTVLENYVRVKIYTERGKESQSQIDIAYLGKNKIDRIMGRTIKPDGTIVELDQKAVFDRTIAKAGRTKVNAKSFAMPTVEPGAIIEYKWREIKNNQLANYVRLPLSRDIPVQNVTYHIKPLSIPGFNYGMRAPAFHAQTTPFVKESTGFYMTSMSKVPAFREEPNMPPEDQVRPWVLLYYSSETKVDVEGFWRDFGKRAYETTKGLLKVNDELKKAAATIVGDATTPDAKLERLYEYCRTQIKNVSDDASGISDEERGKMKENKNPIDTYKRGMGTSGDVFYLFGALATAAGFDARAAFLGDRSDMFFDKNFPDTYFLNMVVMAVKVGDQWRFADPSDTYVPYGMLRWEAEGERALVTDPTAPMWVETPMTPPDRSILKRTATLRLGEDGALEGDVRIEYSGQPSALRKEYNDEDSPTERETTLRDEIKESMSTAEVSDVKIENVTDPVKPFTYSFHVRVPGYAQKTGKRLFLQPAFFRYGANPRFAASERRYDVYFSYPWLEQDEVTIELPKGFALDSPDAPVPVKAGEIAAQDIQLSMKGESTLLCKRTMWFGGQGKIYFPVTTYPSLKGLFDQFHKNDTHTITLKQAAAAAAAGN